MTDNSAMTEVCTRFAWHADHRDRFAVMSWPEWLGHSAIPTAPADDEKTVAAALDHVTRHFATTLAPQTGALQ